jgi:carboxyl-terminal processing protease
MAKKLKVAALVILILFLSASLFTAGYFLGERLGVKRFLGLHPSYGLKREADFRILDEIYTIIQENYVAKVSKEKLMKGAIKGMLDSLGDPYTKHFEPKEFKHVEEVTEGRFEGVGMNLEQSNGDIVVVSPIEGTPAKRAGIEAGDKILEIDGKTTKNMALPKAVSMIRGKSGTKVTLTMLRPATGETLEFTLTREEIKIPNIRSRMEDSDIGYVRLIHTFNTRSGTDVKKAVGSLEEQGAKGIILDLRNNPGGLLEASIEVASAFIDKGPIVSIKGKKGTEKTYKALGGAYSNIPLVVLVNKGSASASEIVAGAVQDTGRGALIGEKTFGKGSVQTIISLSDGSGLIITTARYHTPKGRPITKTGITPDVVVPAPPEGDQTDPQLEKAKEVLRLMIEGKDWRVARVFSACSTS